MIFFRYEYFDETQSLQPGQQYSIDVFLSRVLSYPFKVPYTGNVAKDKMLFRSNLHLE